MHDASDEALRVELNRYSLKTQGLLGRRCPTPMLSGFWKNDPFSPGRGVALNHFFICGRQAAGGSVQPGVPAILTKGIAERSHGWIAQRLC
jgi:esterase FrsA